MRRILLAMLLLTITCPAGAAASREVQTVRDARAVVHQILKIPEEGIPPTLLARAHAIAVFPQMIKAGFILGGRYGRGILLIHRPEGGWSAPIFLELVGGSVGWQIGAQETDVILVFKSPSSLTGIFQGKFTLGADAAVAAGPVGRRVEGATDLQLKAEIYSYSRSRGLFAGVSLEGAALAVDDEANAAYYERPGVTVAAILASEPEAQPLAGQRLILELREIINGMGPPAEP